MMAYSGNIVEYLGCDLAANRPVSLSLTPGALGIFHASDTDELWLWVEGAWISRGSGGGGIPDAPSDGKLYGRKDSAWEEVEIPGPVPDGLTVITESAAFIASPTTHAGLSRYIRAGGDVTFDSGEGYEAGQVFNIRAVAALELMESGVALSPTYGGTLILEDGMSVTVVITSPTTADVIGLTVAA